jgi:hypothetical protein
MGYRSTRIQVLLLRANDLGFGAEKLRKKISAMMNRGRRGPARISALPVTYRLFCQRLPLRVASCPSSIVGASMIGTVSGSFRSIV